MDPTQVNRHPWRGSLTKSIKSSQQSANINFEDPLGYTVKPTSDPLLGRKKSKITDKKSSFKKKSVGRYQPPKNKHDCSKHLKKDTTVDKETENTLNTLLGKRRAQKSFYIADAGSEKANSDDSDHDRFLNVNIAKPMTLNFTNKWDMDSRSPFYDNFTEMDNLQATPVKSRPEKFQFSLDPYYKITTKSKPKEDFNIRVNRKKAHTTKKKKPRQADEDSDENFTSSSRENLSKYKFVVTKYHFYLFVSNSVWYRLAFS